MIVNSARAFIPISDLSVTAKTGEISGDSSSWRQDGDCPWKPGTSGRPIVAVPVLVLLAGGVVAVLAVLVVAVLLAVVV